MKGPEQAVSGSSSGCGPAALPAPQPGDDPGRGAGLNRHQFPPRAAPSSQGRAPVAAFTLIELLAVMVVVLLLAGLIVGLATYSMHRTKLSRARAEIAFLEAACENYWADRGAYPTSTIFRGWIPTTGIYFWESVNAILLLRQLSEGGYVNPTLIMTGSVRTSNGAEWGCTNSVNGGFLGTYTNITEVPLDPWDRPYNYYCTYPRITTGSTSNFINSCTYPYDPNPPYTNPSPTTVVSTNRFQIGIQRSPNFDLWSYGRDGVNNEGTADDIASFR